MELEPYKYKMPVLDLGDDLHSGLEGISFDNIKLFFNKVLMTVDNVKNNLHVFNTLYRGGTINELKDLNSIKSDTDYVTKHNEFYLVENREVAGISGLKSLPMAADKLEELVEYVNKHTLTYLLDAGKILDKFLADEDFRKSFIKSSDVIGMKAWRKGMNIEDTLSSFIDLNTVTDKVKLKNIIPNLISLKNSRENLVKAAEKTDIYQLKKIEEAIDNVLDKVRLIESSIDVLDGTNRIALSSVTEVLSDLGNLVRYHSLVYYITSEVSKVLINIVTTLKKDSK